MSTRNSVAFDASAAIAFALQDEPLHLKAVALVADLAQRNLTLCAPPLFDCEVDSVIRRCVHLGTLTDAEAASARQIIAALSVDVFHDAAVKDRAYQIAIEYSQPRVYDATYAAFAEILGVDLWTADQKFYNSVSGSTAPKALAYVHYVGNV